MQNLGDKCFKNWKRKYITLKVLILFKAIMSSNEETRKDLPFIVVRMFLVTSGKLDEKDATIYALGLKKGTITSSDVAEATGLRQTTSGNRLRRLASKGFFEVTPHVGEAPASGRGYPRKYRVIHPRMVLKDLLVGFNELGPALDLIDQHLEVLAESKVEEGELWLIQPQEMAFRKASAILRGAERTIKIFGHDCTWFRDEGIRNTLKDAVSRGVTVQVLAINPDKTAARGLVNINAELYLHDFPCIPFCLVDDFLLILPKRGGTVWMQYYLIFTTDRYIVDNFSRMYVKILSCSKPYGGE